MSICRGLNVLELGSGSIAASMTGMVLADAGARVVKLEPPESDRLRRTNPSGFLVWNRGKESVVADLRTAPGQSLARSYADRADIVIEGFSPGTTAKWGIDADALRARNARLVHCAITGFGSRGPYSKLKGYDSIVAAKAGLWARGAFGYRDGPLTYPVPWASYGAAMQSVAGIMGALLVRERSGRGQSLAATLMAGLDPLDYFVSTIVQLMAKKGEKASGDSRSATASSRYGVLLVTRDGRFVQTSTLLPHQGKALSDVAGIGPLLNEPRFSRLPMFDTPEDGQAWEDLLLAAFRERDLEYWLPRLLASPDVAFEIAVTSEEGLEHPQIVHNGDAITVDDPRHGPIRQIGPIGHFSSTPLQPARSAPSLGENAGPFEANVQLSATSSRPLDPLRPHPFSGVTIVEFGYFYAMPNGLAMAAALGARVIKIEDIGGDPIRTAFGPEVGSNKTTAAKESICLDLRTPEGRAIVHRLIERADVFVSGFRSGVADKLGLGWDELRALNPRLVYLHAAGYGSDGPYAGRALYAQAAQAVAGSFGRQVGRWADPAKSEGMSVMELQAVVLPRLGQVVDGDSNASLAVLASLALAIYHQQRTGVGQLVRTSMIAGNAWAYSDDFCRYAGKPSAAIPGEDGYGTSALDRAYPAAGGTWICLVVETDAEFARLMAVLDLRGMATDERFASAPARRANDEALAALLEKAFASRPADEWEARLSAERLGCAVANMQGQSVVTAFDPALLESELTTRFTHPLFGEMVRAAPPIAFSETPGRVAPPCLRGQQNRSILAELGYGEDRIRELEASRVVVAEGNR